MGLVWLLEGQLSTLLLGQVIPIINHWGNHGGMK